MATTELTAPRRTGPVGPPRPAVRWLPLPPAARPALPLVALLALYPLWWALGLGILIVPLLAIPMAVALVRKGNIRLPPGFLLWLLFLGVVVVSFATLELDPPGAAPGHAGSRLPGALLRLVEYAALTVLLLYAGNLSERELPRRRLVRLLGWMFVLTVAGGLLGTFWPSFAFTSPVEYALPERLRDNDFIASMVHPAAAQQHEVLGYPTPRPAAPWGYTNVWGNNYLVLVGWFVLAWWVYAKARWQKWAAAGVLAVSVIPVVMSLNRGLWLGLAVAAGYVAIRLALRGRLAAMGAIVAAGAALLLVLLVTPLGGLVNERLAAGHSDSIRVFTTERALAGLPASPVIGFGSTRTTLGSSDSITVGRSASCPHCGNHTIGSNGQLWLELYAHGLLGAALFFGFFLVGLWRYRRDTSPVGLVGTTVLLVNVFVSAYYNTLLTPLAFTFLSLVLLWRKNEAPSPSTAVAR